MAAPHICLQAWPALMSTETAARYLSLDVATLYEIALDTTIGPVAVDASVERWRKSDLDALIGRLRKKDLSASGVDRKIVILDDRSVAQIVEALAKLRGLPERSDAPSLVSIKAAGQTLGLSRTTLYRMMASGKLLSRRIGARTLIPEAEIERLLGG